MAASAELEKTTLTVPAEFPFPFQPYPIQNDFMGELYKAIEHRNLGVFESPTGTGKSMSIICGSLKWLFDSEERKKNDIRNSILKLNEKIKLGESTSSCDWLNEHHLLAKTRDKRFELEHHMKAILEMEQRVQRILKIVVNGETVKSNRKKMYAQLKKIDNEKSETIEKENKDNDGDIDIILDEVNCKERLSDSELDGEEEDRIKDEKEYHCPKIFICSRTHSQLTQLAGEIQKSPYRNLGVRVVCLASRQNMCINDGVLRLKNLSLINEACQDLRSGKSSRATKVLNSGEKVKKQKTSCSGGCPFTTESAMEQLQAESTAEVHDLEELVSAGRELSACPYYTARNSIKDAHVVLIPYQTLLHQNTRKASGIDVTDSVVIIDEAHNLLDTLANIYSATISGLQLSHSQSLLLQYKEKFNDKFSPKNILHLSQLIFVTKQLLSQMTLADKNTQDESNVYRLSEFLIMAGIDNINIYQLLEFAAKSRLANKLRGFTVKYQPTVVVREKKKVTSGRAEFFKSIKSNKALPEVSLKPEEPLDVISGNPVLSLVGFLEALTNHAEDVRLVSTAKSNLSQASLKLMVLNPAAHFSDIVSQARSVIVAGGTMQPFSEFTDQLFLLSGAPSSRISTFSCGHVVPPENILPVVISNGPTGRLLDFSYSQRNNTELLDELGRILSNVCFVVPAGIVVFFPSYEYESKVYQYFADKGIISKLETKKKMLREPKASSQVEQVLTEYSRAASKGALLFSVVGGKLSEGLNFSDDLGRSVVVVGLPYPNKFSPELKEKMKYMEINVGKNSGNVYYENLCMKAVNQSIGRSVRHINDYASVLLLDHRYMRPRIKEALPQWIRNGLETPLQFGCAMGLLAKFFHAKKKS